MEIKINTMRRLFSTLKRLSREEKRALYLSYGFGLGLITLSGALLIANPLSILLYFSTIIGILYPPIIHCVYPRKTEERKSKSRIHESK